MILNALAAFLKTPLGALQKEVTSSPPMSLQMNLYNCEAWEAYFPREYCLLSRHGSNFQFQHCKRLQQGK